MKLNHKMRKLLKDEYTDAVVATFVVATIVETVARCLFTI